VYKILVSKEKLLIFAEQNKFLGTLSQKKRFLMIQGPLKIGGRWLQPTLPMGKDGSSTAFPFPNNATSHLFVNIVFSYVYKSI
jgi:hypothetical protein